jgi:zinc finger CCCH domain-containing protein 13
MALYKNQTGKISALAKTEGKMDLPEATHDTEMLYCAPKGSVVNNLAPHCNVDTMDEGSPSKHEPGDDTGAASPTATGSAGVESPPAISQPDEEMEAVAPHAVTEPDKDIEDVVSPAIEAPADFLDDDAPQATLELASDLQEATPADAMEDVAPSAVGESCHSLEGMPPAVTESSLGKEDASAAASPGSLGIPPIMHEGADTGMEDDMGKAIAAGNGDVNSSGLAPEFNVPTCDAQDPEALLVESRINLSRIRNSPESTH